MSPTAKKEELVPIKDTLPAGLSQEELDGLLADQDEEFDDDVLSTPIFKIGQGLTREVQDGAAEAGEFIDSLRGEGVGTKIGFIVSYYNKGRFAADRDTGRAYVAWGDTIPENWADLLGEEWVGTRFDEHADAEEVFKQEVNEKKREWGKGPLISTTHNFTGFAIVPGFEGEPDEMRPARISLQRTNVPAAMKWQRLKRSALRGRPFWEVVFDLGTEKKQNPRGVSYNLTVTVGRKTTDEERAEAAQLALMVRAGRVVDNSATAEDGAVGSAPDANGGLGV